MSDSALLADFIDERIESILAHWRSTVEQIGDVPEANRLDRSEFYDHVPELLERLSERLRNGSADPTAEGRKHGELRWKQGYDLGEIVNEFSHLRSTLLHATFQFAKQQRPQLDLETLERLGDAIHDVIDGATAESVKQFQFDSRRDTHEALNEVKLRQQAVEEAWVNAQIDRVKLQTILRSLPVAVRVVDADGRIVSGNEQAERLGLDRPIFYKDGEPIAADALPLQRALRGEVVSDLEVVLGGGGDDRTFLLINAAPLNDLNGSIVGAVAVASDITSRVALEASLKQQRTVAEESSLHKTRLVSALSHDARTPLNAVVLAAHLLELHFDGEFSDDIQQCLQTIRLSVRNVLDLLNDLLNLSKIEAGALPAEVSRFPLEPVLTECLSNIENQARQKGLDVAIEIGDLANTSLATDRVKLKQILGNLLSNSLRYTEKGSIRIFGKRHDDSIVIGVTDTGIGIAENDLARIFDEFAMIETPGRRVGEGTGLGLAISSRLAILLDGRIEVESQLGVGSSFRLRLPVSTLTLNSPAEIGVVSDQANKPRPTGAILVAEDHEESRLTLGKVLRRMGYRVLEAANGHEALMAAENEPNLTAILMDVNMPVMDGIAATLAFRSNPTLRDVPIFALTGDVTIVNQDRIGKAGVNGYLEKPVTWDALRDAIESVGKRKGS